VSAIRLLGGEPVCVYGEQVLGPTGVDIAFTGTAVCADDVLAHFDCGFAMPYRAELEVAGEEGVAVLHDPWHATRPGIALRRGDDTAHVDVPEANSYRLQLENVGAAIRGEAPLLLGREDAVAQARALEALYAAASRGEAVEVTQRPLERA
jgi:predicted dehydrogenase